VPWRQTVTPDRNRKRRYATHRVAFVQLRCLLALRPNGQTNIQANWHYCGRLTLLPFTVLDVQSVFRKIVIVSSACHQSCRLLQACPKTTHWKKNLAQVFKHSLLKKGLYIHTICWWGTNCKKVDIRKSHTTITGIVTGWYRTRRPKHCDHFWSIELPHLRSNRYWFIYQSSLAVTSRHTR
jgi:hypothetical protein